MIETSKDILNLTAALAIASLTVFLCWALYLMISMLKQANEVVKNAKEKIQAAGQMINEIREKMIHSATSLNIMAKAFNKIIDFFQERKEKKKKKKQTEEDF